MKGFIAGLAMVATVGAAHGASVEDRYNSSCTFCHSTGAAGAPHSHNEAEWKPRLAKGMDTLLKHVKEGYNAMPPRGMCNDCSDEEYRALIKYMSKSK
ncbi:cytochrome c-type protein [Alcanivorax hongdengensis A-11-3]|uniref:Cytochrome c-type protein n=1 Tax=Alcanivorax hongdengensis A-11-3 TaxID=1177179 RepID=L0WAX3_9GAMM|nr:c-type cytochrome [Alcanivorax hongdengensis]EKF73888.1 cytochrome c-type protein [Alcanivorax hongdengensis A-11-3]